MLQTPPRKQRHKATTLLAFDDVMERRLDNTWYICTVLRVNHKEQTVDIHYKDTGNPEYDVPYDQDLRPVVSHRTPPLDGAGAQPRQNRAEQAKFAKHTSSNPPLETPLARRGCWTPRKPWRKAHGAKKPTRRLTNSLKKSWIVRQK